ncbi:MAG: hypothetical protein ACRECX_01225 [Methyloceanibacter sp.]|uniref:hypothetical protein n=1 Tax=Methyloceanibacter sp. TaxID=1965321 RepID=UPI003D6D3D59
MPARQAHRRAGDACAAANLAGIVALFLFAVTLPSAASADQAQDLFSTSAKASTETVDHDAWNRILKTYVKPGSDGLNRVDYTALNQDGLQPLRAYI